MKLAISTPLRNGVVTVAFNLATGSSGCTASVCVERVKLQPKLPYAAVITTYSASGEGGTQLSSGQEVAFTAARDETISIALTGSLAGIAVTTGALAVHGSATSGFTLYGTTAQPLIVAGLDRNGKILAGAASPSVTGSVTAGSGWSIAPSASTPNAILVEPPNKNGASAHITVTASNGRVKRSTTLTIKNDVQTLFATNINSTGPDQLLAFTPPYTGTPQKVGSQTFDNLNMYLESVAVDGSGNVFVGASGGGCVTYVGSGAVAHCIYEFTPPYDAAPAANIETDGGFVFGGGVNNGTLTFDTKGHLFALENGGNPPYNNNATIWEYAAPYNSKPLATVTLPTNQPMSIAVNAAGDLFSPQIQCRSSCTNLGVLEYAPPYTGKPVYITQGLTCYCWGMAVDSRQHLFVTSQPNGTGAGVGADGAVTDYAPPYTQSPVATTTNGVFAPTAVFVDRFEDLFVLNQGGGGTSYVTVYAPPYTGQPLVTIKLGVSNAIQMDGAGNLFIAEYEAATGALGGGDILEYAPPYTGKPIRRITGWFGAGADPYTIALTP